MTTRVLLINPNTSQWVTQALVEQIDRVLPADASLSIDAATATLGASYIASEAAYAIAAHALLDCFAANYQDHDAVAVGCFGDPGVSALAEISGLPIVGMADAAMREASETGNFAIVTGGQAWDPMLRRLAQDLGYGQQLCSVIAVTQSAAELAQDRPNALAILAQACQQAHAEGATKIILGGAAFAGYGDELSEQTGLPVIDSVSAMTRALSKLAHENANTSPSRAKASADGAQYSGLAPALSELVNKHSE